MDMFREGDLLLNKEIKAPLDLGSMVFAHESRESAVVLSLNILSLSENYVQWSLSG